LCECEGAGQSERGSECNGCEFHDRFLNGLLSNDNCAARDMFLAHLQHDRSRQAVHHFAEANKMVSAIIFHRVSFELMVAFELMVVGAG
jgi:hypothetical protein